LGQYLQMRLSSGQEDAAKVIARRMMQLESAPGFQSISPRVADMFKGARKLAAQD
jgi:hypothetical protein